jgi:type IV pilus assembly protein PilE
VDKSKGFTLIELMIVAAIVAILAAIALPSYQEHIRKTRRAQGKADMMELTQRLERTYTTDRAYTAATTICDQTLNSPSTGTTYYQLATECDATTFTVTATPQGTQTSDRCGTLSINQLGTKTPTTGTDGATICW